MSHDKTKSIKQIKTTKKEKEKNNSNQFYKKNKDSDSEDDDDYTSEHDDEMDTHEYRKFLAKIFPSKNLNNKIKSGEKLKKVLKNENLEINKNKSKKKRIK